MAYKIFEVARENAILPEGSGLGQAFHRVTGDRIVEIIDANENGVPDSGDTGIDASGYAIPNLKLTGAVQTTQKGTVTILADVKDHLRHLTPRTGGHTYVSTPIELGSALDFFTGLAFEGDVYYERQKDGVKRVVGGITESPTVVAAITLGATFFAQFKAGKLALKALAIGGAAYGTGSVIADRAKGLARGTTMGEHDVDSFLWMSGVAPFVKGVSAEAALVDPLISLTGKARAAGARTVQTCDQIAATFIYLVRLYLSRIGKLPPPDALVTNSGAIFTGTLDAAPTAVAAGGTIPPIIGGTGTFPALLGLPVYRSITADLGSGPRTIEPNGSSTPPPVETSLPEWDRGQIRSVYDDLIRELEGYQAVCPEQAKTINGIKENIETIKFTYDELPWTREKLLLWLTETKNMFKNMDTGTGTVGNLEDLAPSFLRRIRDFTKIIIEENKDHLKISRVRKSNIPRIPEGYKLSPEAEVDLEGSSGLREKIPSIIAKIEDFYKAGLVTDSSKPTRDTVHFIKEVKANAVRAYFARGEDGTIHILRVHFKKGGAHQDRAIAIADAIAGRLGLPTRN